VDQLIRSTVVGHDRLAVTLSEGREPGAAVRERVWAAARLALDELGEDIRAEQVWTELGLT
jgi:hypothetical protein